MRGAPPAVGVLFCFRAKWKNLRDRLQNGPDNGARHGNTPPPLHPGTKSEHPAPTPHRAHARPRPLRPARHRADAILPMAKNLFRKGNRWRRELFRGPKASRRHTAHQTWSMGARHATLLGGGAFAPEIWADTEVSPPSIRVKSPHSRPEWTALHFPSASPPHSRSPKAVKFCCKRSAQRLRLGLDHFWKVRNPKVSSARPGMPSWLKSW